MVVISSRIDKHRVVDQGVLGKRSRSNPGSRNTNCNPHQEC
jgi:hypothetical protein